MSHSEHLKIGRQRRNAILTIAITAALLALFVGLSPGGGSSHSARGETQARLQPASPHAVHVRVAQP